MHTYQEQPSVSPCLSFDHFQGKIYLQVNINNNTCNTCLLFFFMATVLFFLGWGEILNSVKEIGKVVKYEEGCWNSIKIIRHSFFNILSFEPESNVVVVTWFWARSLRYSVLVRVAIAINFSHLWAAFSALITTNEEK